MNIKSKRILVSGGAGFVGSNLCERLLREGHHVVCLDNLYTGSLDNIKEFLKDANFEFHQVDILDQDALEGLKSLDIDEIYHLACPASPVHYKKMPYTQPESAWREPSTCWSWHATSSARYSFPPPARSMETRRYTPRQRIISAT